MREMSQGRIIRKLRRDAGALYFQLTKEYLTSKEILYSREAELSLDMVTGAIGGDMPELIQEAKKLLDEHLAKRLTSDLTRLIQHIYDDHRADLIPIREAGGAYFVPDKHSFLVDKTRTLLQEIGGKLRSFAVRLGSADTAESVADSLSDYLLELINQFKMSCEDVSRKDAFERREAKIGELKQKLATYSGLLSGYADLIKDEINKAESVLLEKMAMEMANA
jgi:hypothetical protein